MKSMFSFQGRVSRGRFWLGMLPILVASSLSPFMLLILDSPAGELWAAPLSILCLGVIWVFLALCAKRLRDAGLSPWLCLLFLVMFANFVVFFIAGFKPTAADRELTRSGQGDVFRV